MLFYKYSPNSNFWLSLTTTFTAKVLIKLKFKPLLLNHYNIKLIYKMFHEDTTCFLKWRIYLMTICHLSSRIKCTVDQKTNRDSLFSCLFPQMRSFHLVPPRRPRAPLWWVWPRQGAIPWGSQLFGSEGQRLSPTCFPPPPVASLPVSECLTFLPQSDTRHTTSGRTPSTGITVVISVSDPSVELVSTRVISVREWGDAIASAVIVFYCCASAGDDVVIRAKGW